MRFVVRLYEKQVNAGRIFVHANPAHAKAWPLPESRNVMRRVGVDMVEAGQCMYGLDTWGKTRSHLVLSKKPTSLMNNFASRGRNLSKGCDGSHAH